MKQKFVDVENTRTPEQREIYEKIDREGFDPFSLEHFQKNHPHPIFFENDSWFATLNAFPYTNTSLHILLIHKEFITSLEEISQKAWVDLQETINFCIKKYGLNSGSFFMRFGDTTKTGSTVTHLHAHILVSDGSSDERRSMYVAIS
jgi:diadenosine tetraphosphate (Ap4A) HIT family hydrolase